MENLIKSIMEQLAIVAESRKSQQELMKTAPNGQWELLSKAKTPAGPVPVDHAVSNNKLTDLFGELNNQIKASNAGKISYVNGARGAIRSYALGLPKGKIDLGHLGKLRDAQVEHSQPLVDAGGDPLQGNMARRYSIKPITHNHMMEIMNHHIGDAPSMKHIHDNNGGIPAIETLARTMGANGDPAEYSDFKLKPEVHAELLDLVRPGKHKWPWDKGLKHSVYENTHASPEHEQEVEEAHDDLMSEDEDGVQGYDVPEIRKRLTNAATARAIARFKEYHKID